MNNNDNEIKFIKGRSNDSEVLVDLFKKDRYYDAFYGLKRLEKSEQIKFLPLVAEAYAKLNKSDYEANALLKLLMNSEGMKNENGLDKRVIALRLSDYYTYKGEKVQRLSFSYNDTQSNGKTTRQRNSQKTGDIIKFQIKESNGNEASTLQLLDEECNIYKKNNIRTDYGTYICSRATSLALAGKYNKAISVLQQIKKGDPSYLESRNILIAVLIDSSKVLQASEIAIELIKENPDEFIALFAINTALNLSINTDNILNALMEIEGKTGAQCSVLRANAFGTHGEFLKAIEILDQLGNGDKYSIDVLRVKAICYSGLEDKAREEEVLKQIITIYPMDIKARCILAKMQRGENASSKMMGLGTMSDCLADDFKQFYENKLVNLSGENFSIEEIAYYYELCLRFGSNEIIKNCTDEYLKCNRFTDVIYDALIDITLDDFKKMLVVERLVLAGVDGECFSLINGMMKKLNLSSIKYLISQFKDTMSESFYDNNEANEPLNNVIDNAFAKAYSLSLLFDIDGAEIANKLGALILYASLHKSDESIDFIKTLYNENNLAFSACILINPQLAKMPKLKKYLGLKNIEIDEIINALKKAGFR